MKKFALLAVQLLAIWQQASAASVQAPRRALLGTITGTPGDDILSGTAGVDTIYGLDGNDKIEAGAGKDMVYGGPGNDFLDGAAGNDHLLGEDGNDVLADGDGANSFSGGAGDDKLITAGTDGLTACTSRIGNNLLTGGQGMDVFRIGGGDWVLDFQPKADNGIDIYAGDCAAMICPKDPKGYTINGIAAAGAAPGTIIPLQLDAWGNPTLFIKHTKWPGTETKIRYAGADHKVTFADETTINFTGRDLISLHNCYVTVMPIVPLVVPPVVGPVRP